MEEFLLKEYVKFFLCAQRKSSLPKLTEIKQLKFGPLGLQLISLKPEMANAAQKIVDEWTQDEEGIDCEFGSGGACDAISRELSFIISSHLGDANITEGGQDGNDHSWLIVYNDNEAYEVDIPPGVYETGEGYSWKKIEGAKIRQEDVIIEPVPREWFEFEEN